MSNPAQVTFDAAGDAYVVLYGNGEYGQPNYMEKVDTSGNLTSCRGQPDLRLRLGS